MIFQLVQKNLSILGIKKTPLSRSSRIREIIGGLLLSTHIISRLKFLVTEANTLQLYTQSAFTSSVAIANLSILTSLIYKREEIYKFIDGAENLLILFKECKFCMLLREIGIFFNKFFCFVLSVIRRIPTSRDRHFQGPPISRTML